MTTTTDLLSIARALRGQRLSVAEISARSGVPLAVVSHKLRTAGKQSLNPLFRRWGDGFYSLTLWGEQWEKAQC